MDDDEYEVQIAVLPSQRFRLINLAVVCLDTVTSFTEGLLNLTMQHANYQIDREQAAEEMRQSIERIVTE